MGKSMKKMLTKTDYADLAARIKQWGLEFGFQQIGITDANLSAEKPYLVKWLHQGRHGEMTYMARHLNKRTHPGKLVPGTMRIISIRMDYFPEAQVSTEKTLNNRQLGYISRYATGRDYHKIIRRRLQKLADKITEVTGRFGYRAFADSAPVLEKAIARNAGLGWIGKHTNLINPQAGSWFFLGELYTDLPLPVDAPFANNHCGSCTACMDICPTQAITGPYQLDARRCISYLTIEHRGAIPEQFRTAIGNRIYGCDDCQLVCPWNKFAQKTGEKDFTIQDDLRAPTLVELFNWSEAEFLKKMEGSAIRRIGYISWLRNIAVALGNFLGKVSKDDPASQTAITVLENKKSCGSALVKEHIDWALRQI